MEFAGPDVMFILRAGSGKLFRPETPGVPGRLGWAELGADINCCWLRLSKLPCCPLELKNGLFSLLLGVGGPLVNCPGSDAGVAKGLSMGEVNARVLEALGPLLEEADAVDA